MSEVENVAAVSETAPKNNYETLEESIGKMKLCFANASLPEIFVVMATVGYTAEKIAELSSKVAQFEILYQAQIKEHADQSEEQNKLDKKRAEINKKFNTDRNLLRILFKGNIQAWVALQLDGENPKAYATWTQLVNNFYAQLSGNPDLLTKVAGVGITVPTISAQQLAMAELQALKESLRKETGEAQAATDIRDRTFDEIYPQYSEYIKYAKILLPDNQLLEAIGVKVRAK